MGAEAQTTSTTETPAVGDSSGDSSSNLTPRPDIQDANVVLNGGALAVPPEPVVETTPTEDPETPATTPSGDSLSGDALKSRLQRERDKVLKDAWGTSDPEEIKALRERQDQDKKRLDLHERKQKARERARMTADEKRTKDSEAKDDRIKELETQLTGVRQDSMVEKQEALINESASAHIKPERLRYAKRDLADHIKGLTPEKRAKFDQKQLGKFFETFAATNPDFAVVTETAEPAPAPAKPKPKPRLRKGITTSTVVKKAPAPVPADGPGMMNGKTVKPGQANSMNSKELREYYVKRGGKRPY